MDDAIAISKKFVQSNHDYILIITNSGFEVKLKKNVLDIANDTECDICGAFGSYDVYNHNNDKMQELCGECIESLE